MIIEHCKERQDAGQKCSKSHCGRTRTQHIYGLCDVRLRDIFYVGSTFYPGERFADHLKSALKPIGVKSLWLRSILESGSYPLPILLHEFQTTCDNYTRGVEKQIAEQLRTEGHTALCDDYLTPSELTLYMQKTFPRPQEPTWWELKHMSTKMGEIAQEAYQEEEKRYNSTGKARLELLWHLEDQWMSVHAEHGRVTCMLKEMFECA